MASYLKVPLLLAASFLLVGAQQSPPAEPWKWTLEQRLAARFDPHARAARVADPRAKGVQAMSAFGPVPSDVIDGSKHPELFLPTEIFEHFVWLAYTLESPLWRESMRDRSPDILRTDAEWRDLDAIVAPYANSLKRDGELLKIEDRSSAPKRREIERERANIQATRCSLLRDAFRGARARFGKERFDRFLYTVPTVGFASSYAPENDFEKDRERVLQIEERCQ
jgi:hypothetical protein